MSNNTGPIPKGAIFFACQILNRFKLEKASSIEFIEKVIRAAVQEQQEVDHAR